MPRCPAFIVELRERNGAAQAFEFLILTAARTDEVLGATWDEFDLDLGLWTVPKERMKGGREHRVPLSERAIEILEAQSRTDERPFSFAANVFLQMLKRMGRANTSRGTASVRASAIGPVIAQPSRARLPKRPWRMRSRTRPKRPTGAPTPSISAAG